MTDRDELSRELIELLGGGATVVQLLRHCRAAIGEDRPRKEWVDAVRAAFGLYPTGWFVERTEAFGNGKMPDSNLTWVFLPTILANRAAWDAPDGSPRWFDGLAKHPIEDHHRTAETSHGLSADGWAALGERDKATVRMIEATRLALGEDVQILAALAERLQQRVNELERQAERTPAAAGQ